METQHVLKRPIDTEKLDRIREIEQKFAFEVDQNATKLDVKRAVEAAFKVTVTEVRTMIVRGKERRIGKSQGRRPNWKKAIVSLKEGDTIKVFEGK